MEKTVVYTVYETAVENTVVYATVVEKTVVEEGVVLNQKLVNFFKKFISRVGEYVGYLEQESEYDIQSRRVSRISRVGE